MRKLRERGVLRDTLTGEVVGVERIFQRNSGKAIPIGEVFRDFRITNSSLMTATASRPNDIQYEEQEGRDFPLRR